MATRITQAQISLRVFKATAKRFGLDYDRFRFVKYPSGWGLEHNGEHLLDRAYHTAKDWCFILDGADSSLKAVEILKYEQEKNFVSIQISKETIEEWQKLTGMHSENVASEISAMIEHEIDFHKEEQGIDD